MTPDDKPGGASDRTGRLLLAFLIGCAPAGYTLGNIEHYFDARTKDAEIFVLLASAVICALLAGYIVATTHPKNGRAVNKAIYTVVFGLGFAALGVGIVFVGCSITMLSKLR